MKEKENLISKEWPENYGRAWVELLEAELSTTAKIIYVAMTSFGPGPCRAGYRAIMARTSIKNKTTFWAGVSELTVSGWMTKLSTGNFTEPSHWRMHQTPKGVGTVGTQGGGYKEECMVGTVGTPKQEEDLKQERPKTPAQAPKPAKHPDQDAFWTSAQASWKAKNPSAAPLAWPKFGRGKETFQLLLTAELHRLGAEELSRRWENCVTDPWSQPSLRTFMLEPDKWVNQRVKSAAPARSFNAPETDWKPSGKRVGE